MKNISSIFSILSITTFEDYSVFLLSFHRRQQHKCGDKKIHLLFIYLFIYFDGFNKVNILSQLGNAHKFCSFSRIIAHFISNSKTTSAL